MSQTKRAYDKFLLYAMLIIALGVVGFISATTVIDPGYINTTGPILGSTGTFSGALTGTTLDTGQGANELFDMDQNVLQASDVTFENITISKMYVLGLQLNVVNEINTDLAYCGQVAIFEANDVITAGQLIRWDTGGHIQRADADAANTMPCVGLALNSTTAGHNGLVLMQGWIYNSAWTLAEGKDVFVGLVGGSISTTAPSDSGDQVQVVGIGQTEDLMWFNPDYTVMEIT